MTIFTEGQDPLDQGLDPSQPAGRMPTGLPESAPFTEPGGNSVVAAAFRQNNPIASVLDAITRSRPDMTPVPGYDPVARLKGTKDDDLIDQSLADVNPAQTDARIAKKQQEQKDQQTLAASGGFGTIASIAAGATDPSWFIPILGEVKGAEAAGLTVRALRGMGEGFAKSAVSEAALQASQVTRTPTESANNIATNTLLMGLVGGGMSMLERGERAAANDGLDAIRNDLSGFPAYHGSPHDFDAFSMEKIGTGEGAQAYGHGLYFAENEGVARSYRDALTDATVEGKKYDPYNPLHVATAQVDESGSRASAVKDMEATVKADTDPMQFTSRVLAILKSDRELPKVENASGNLYKVKITADKDHMLDWDKPLSEQSESVREAVKPLMEKYGMEGNFFGSEIYQGIIQHHGANGPGFTPDRKRLAETVSKELGGVGIPGIKYLDAGSRDAAEGSRNFVVFNDKHVQITDKNGQPVAKQGELPFVDKTSIVPHEPIEPKTLTSSLSAAESDARTMKLSRILLPDNMMTALKEAPFIGNAINYTSKVLMNFSPTLRIFSSDSMVAKRALGDLAETSLRFTQADSGITTARGGVPIDRMVKMQTHEGQLTGSQILRDAFVQYRELSDSRAPIIAAGIQDVRGQAPGKLSFDKFKDEVSGAMTAGDVHAIPEVQQAAQQIRSKVLEPVKQMAQRTMGPDGKPMLGEELEAPKGDKSFFPRVWNKQALAANYNGAKKIFADWLEGEQGIKAAAKDRITAYNGALQLHENNIAKIEAKLQGRYDQLEALQDKGEEITRLNKFAYERAAKLRQAETQRIENARGGAVFETKIRNRGNTLADQASGKTGEIGTLEDQLIRETDSAKAMRTKIEKEIADWQGQSTQEAKTALKTRAEAEKLREQKMAEGTYEGAGERLTGADTAVDRAVKRILKSDRDLSREELENRAAEIMNRINTTADGRLPYDTASGGMSAPVPNDAQAVRGSLNARDFAIPTSLVRDFVNTDTEHVIAAHLRATIPDIHLTDRFGDIEMSDVMRRLDEEYDSRLSQAKSSKQQTDLDTEKKAMVRDLAATRDRIRGIYGFNLAAAQPNAARIANAARNFNLITDLGTSVFNRMTDSINAVYRHGFMNVMGDGYLPFFKSMVGMGEGFATASRQSMKDMGVGIDSAIGHLSHQYADVIDNTMPGSRFERALGWSADKSMMLNLHGPWTDGMKTVAGTVAAADFLRTAERVSKGEHTAADTQRLAQAGIDQNMAGRIWEAYSNGGGQEFGKGTHVANTADWADTQARDVFSAAIARDADMAVLTPGAEKPLWMSGPVVSLLGQYKSFVAAAHEKVLISNLQQMDARTLQGLVASLGMGMISYRAYTLWSGSPFDPDPRTLLKEGISRSAITGWFSEINSMQAKFTGGKTDMFQAIGVDKPLSRRQSNGALSELLGPTYAKLEGIAGGVNDASHGTWTAMDTHKMRQAVFLQNLFLVRRLFDHVEDGVNENLGIKPLDRESWPVH